MDRKPTHDSLEVRDLAVASYLYSSGEVTLVGKQRLFNGVVVFSFSPKDKTEQLISRYWSLQALAIQPKLLFSAQRDLKDMIFGG